MNQAALPYFENWQAWLFLIILSFYKVNPPDSLRLKKLSLWTETSSGIKHRKPKTVVSFKERVILILRVSEDESLPGCRFVSKQWSQLSNQVKAGIGREASCFIQKSQNEICDLISILPSLTSITHRPTKRQFLRHFWSRSYLVS